MNNCVCGRELDGTNNSPWISYSASGVGDKILSGICIHGIYFPPVEEEKKEDSKTCRI